MPNTEAYFQPPLSAPESPQNVDTAPDASIIPIDQDPAVMPHGRLPNDFWPEFHNEWTFREAHGMLPVAPAEFSDMRDLSDGVLYDRTEAPVDKEQKRVEVYQKLLEGVEALHEEPAYKAYLDAMGKFHNYSFGNVMLIHSQDPEATQVAGYNRWKALGRQVEKGAKGIPILVPHMQKIEDDDGEELFVARSFGIGHVFDVRHTKGDPLPEAPEIHELTNDDPLGDELFSRINDVVTDRIGVPWHRQHFYGHSRGMWNPRTQTIALREGLYPAQEVKTFLHESIHALRRDDLVGADPDGARSSAEMIAESSSYVVLNHFGISTESYSFPYIASWTKDTDQLRERLQAIQETSNDMIAMIAGGVEPGESL